MKHSYFIFLVLGTIVMFQIGCNDTGPSIATNQEIWFHPMTAHADRAGPLPTKLILINDDGLGAGLIIRASEVVRDEDYEWVMVDLPLPVFNAEGLPWRIDSLEVCYDISTSNPEETFISQLRLAEMTTPERAIVRHDDGTNLTSTTPSCYVSDVGDVLINGTYSLEVRIAIGNVNDSIRIGAIRVFLKI